LALEEDIKNGAKPGIGNDILKIKSADLYKNVLEHYLILISNKILSYPPKPSLVMLGPML